MVKNVARPEFWLEDMLPAKTTCAFRSWSAPGEVVEKVGGG